MLFRRPCFPVFFTVVKYAFVRGVGGRGAQAVENVPSKDAGDLYIRYAKLEETHGLMRHAASVMDRACAAVEESEKLDMFRLYVAKVWYAAKIRIIVKNRER